MFDLGRLHGGPLPGWLSFLALILFIHTLIPTETKKRLVSDLKLPELRTPRYDLEARRTRSRFGTHSHRPRSQNAFRDAPVFVWSLTPLALTRRWLLGLITRSFTAPDAFTLVPTRRVPSSRRVRAVSGRLVSTAEATRGSPRAMLHQTARASEKSKIYFRIGRSLG